MEHVANTHSDNDTRDLDANDPDVSDLGLANLLSALIVSQQRLAEALLRVVDIASKHPCSVSLIAIEIHELATYAHNQGVQVDKVVASVGKTISAQLRNIDLIGYSPDYGHTFTVITAPAFHVEGEQVAVRLCQSISALELNDLPQLQLTCGVSSYRSGDTPDSLLTRAQKALAKAKLSGSGCIASDGANESELLL
ncbi:MAG: diguanylate cyclase [Deinococcota bacterium]